MLSLSGFRERRQGCPKKRCRAFLVRCVQSPVQIAAQLFPFYLSDYARKWLLDTFLKYSARNLVFAVYCQNFWLTEPKKVLQMFKGML